MQEPACVGRQMLAGLSASTKTVSAVLAGIWDDDMCKGSKALPQLAAASDMMNAQAMQGGKPLQSDLQLQQHQLQQPVAVSHQQQSPARSAAIASTAQPAEQARQPRQRRPSRSAPVSPVRGSSSPPTSSGRAGYSTDAYWDNRYAERSTHFDWFYNYSALASLINKAIDKQGPCLHVGCGNSGLSLGMARDGYQVVNVDISAVVIDQMRRLHNCPGQSWEVADCRNMPQYRDGSFCSVLDKGTLDAVLCSSHGQADIIDYVNEVHRLLMPGGVFLLISLGQPHARLAVLNALSGSVPAVTVPGLQYLSDKYQQLHLAVAAAAAGAAAKGTSGYDWAWDNVEVYLLPKPSLYLAGEMSLTGRAVSTRTSSFTDKDMPVAWLGPFSPGDELDAAIAEQAVDLREYFTAFVCKKKGSGRDIGSNVAVLRRPSACAGSSRSSGRRLSCGGISSTELAAATASNSCAAAAEGLLEGGPAK